MQSLVNSVAPGPDSSKVLSHPTWIDQLERTLALFTLLQLQAKGENTYPSAQGKSQSAIYLGNDTDSESHRRMEIIKRYVSTRLAAPISLEDLARAASVRPRTVYMDCMRHAGIGPAAWLRTVRLEAARQKIIESPSRNVTDIAMECGFGHLGRFSAYYRERFNELPSETARVLQS